MKYRTEWKYIVDARDIDLLDAKIRSLLKLDSNANSEVYNIHSLYFDDYVNTCAFDNDAGADDRFKWRIRYYDEDTSFIRLEKKLKKNDLCFKKSCRLDADQYQKIVDGNIAEMMWDTEDILLKEFCIDCLNRKFEPKIIIDYERTAFVEPISNVRITFDKNISGSLNIDRFMKRDYLKYPLQKKDQHILEVKFDDILPGYMEKALHVQQLQRNTFSKYYLGRVILERNLL